MKLIHRGLHKNIGFLIQHIGGYDQEYHITTLANKLNINREDINTLFKESSRKNLYHYIELLENCMSIEKVFDMMEKDNRIATRNLRATMSAISNSRYSKLF